jgi:branched-chain amino acid aminotransferase
MELAEAEGLEVREEMFRLHDLYNADEFFITGTAAEVVPGVKVDGRLIADGKPGPITQRLRKRYQELTTTEGTPIK